MRRTMTEASTVDALENQPKPNNFSFLSDTRFLLFTSSLLCLFCEMVVIRWLSTEVRIFSYFKNLPLASAMLGLGLGFLWTDHKRDYFSKTPTLITCLAIILICAFSLQLTYMSFIDPTKYIVYGVNYKAGQELLTMAKNIVILLAIFSLSTGIFVGFGQYMGRLFGKLPALQAYSINIAGSLAGTILFSIFSWMALPPAVWLTCIGLLLLLINRNTINFFIIALGICYGLFLAPTLAHQAYGNDYVKTCWSPYYRIDIRTVSQQLGNQVKKLGYNVAINFDTFQSIVDCSPETLKSLPPQIQKSLLEIMTGPYKAVPVQHPRVLILGCGTGSDVATALRCGAEHVDAVEIDPQILKLGKELHPEHPYFSPKVTLFNEDARTFLKNATNKYDLIVLAALDSHTAFSSLSSLRTDNYIFTRESLKEAARLLSDNGIIAENFYVPNNWLFNRHAATLAQATGLNPFGYHSGELSQYAVGGLIAGPGLKRADPQVLASMKMTEVKPDSSVEITTDDWPFLFLERRELPVSYILPLSLILLISIAPVAGYVTRGSSQLLNWQMLLLGMGFMLLEVRTMAIVSLLLGSTWIVNSLVISAVLLLVLLANWLAAKLDHRKTIWMTIPLVGALAISQVMPATSFLPFGSTVGPALACLVYLMPMFFSSTIFASLFKDARTPSSALAFNIIGSIFGIALEYLSMATGVAALGMVAFVIYGLLIVLMLSGLRATSTTEATTAAGQTAS